MKYMLALLTVCLSGSVNAMAPHVVHGFRQSSKFSGTVFCRTLTPGKKWLVENAERKQPQELPRVQLVSKECRAEELKKDARMLGLVICLAGSSVVGVYKFHHYTKGE